MDMLLRLTWCADAANSICRTAGAGLLAAGHTAAALPWLWQADGSAALHQVAAQLQAKSQDLDVLAQSKLSHLLSCINHHLLS